MFVQFIEGPVADAQALRGQLDRWHEQLAGGASGWLGSTGGVTADGTGFLAARFESAEAARANSERPEQSAWWAETERAFGGPVSFTDYDGVALMRAGGSDDAGFVQVIRGQVNDVAAAREMFLADMPDDVRPDVLGGIVGLMPDGAYTMVVYFSSEEEARAGEAGESGTSGEAAASGEGGEDYAQQMDALHDEPPRYLDLSDPWLWSG